MTGQRGAARPVESGILLRDLNWSGTDTDDLGKVMRELPMIIDLIDEMAQYAPFVTQSKIHPGCLEHTALGETLDDLQKWLQYQLDEAYQALREAVPRADWSEARMLDLIAYMARHVGDAREIASVAMTLEAQPTASLPRADHTWTKRYLSERKVYA